MNKKFTISLIIATLLMVLILAACSSSSTQQQANGFSGFGNGTSEANFRTQPLSLAQQLVIGTFKLEGTKNAITADEAAKLIPLWQVYKNLTSSSSAAQEEIDALAQQIQSTMTPAQVQAITDMKLTRQDMFDVMQKLGISSGRGNNASGTPRPGGNFGGGGFPGGGPGGPGGGPNGQGGSLSPQQIATFQARRAQNGGNGFANRIPTALYDALVKLLQDKK